MAKAHSPVRLQADLMDAASTTGKLMHRSTAEQIEYWASVGRRVSSQLSPDNIVALSSGLANIIVEPVVSNAIDPDAVFESLEYDRSSGNLANTISASESRFQASNSHPGYLEKINPQGHITVGQFTNGTFVPITQ